nr:hypothetical protein [Tanacetum cinerariifolium]
MEEERFIDAAKLIIMELKLNTVLSNKAWEVLLDLGARLASLAKLSDVMVHLESISQKMVDEVRRLVERFEGFILSEDSEEYKILRKANDVLQMYTEDDSFDESLRFSFRDDSVNDSFQRDSISRGAKMKTVLVTIISTKLVNLLVAKSQEGGGWEEEVRWCDGGGKD